MVLIVFLYNWFFVYLALCIVAPHITAGILSFLIMAALAQFIQTPIGEKWLRMKNGCLEPNKMERDYIQPIIEDICRATRIHVSVPSLFIVEDERLNAGAIGKETIAVTTGLLRNTSADELKGVLAHEIGHLQHKDSQKIATIYTLNVAGNIATWGIGLILAFIGTASRSADRTGIFSASCTLLAIMLRLVVGITSRVLGWSICSIGRKEEFLADAFAVEVGAGEGLLSMLKKLNGYHKKNKKKGISYRKTVLQPLNNTHPSLEERIETIERLLNTSVLHNFRS